MSDSSESMQAISKMLPDKSFAVGEVMRVALGNDNLMTVELMTRHVVLVDESLYPKLIELKGKEVSITHVGNRWSCAPMMGVSRP